MMWLRRLLDYIEKHRYQALGLIFLLTFVPVLTSVPVLGVLGILIATLITLIKGALEGAIFTAAATIPFLLGFWWHGGGELLPLTIWASIGVAVTSNILTWVFAVMLRRRTSWSVMLQVAALMGVLVISVLHMAYPDIATWWGEQLQSLYNQMASVASAATDAQSQAAVKETVKAVKPALTDVQIESISLTKYYASGMMVSTVLFNAFVQLMAARWLQGSLYSPRMLRRELHGIRLSPLAGILFILASIIFWYLGNSVVLDIMPILYLLFGAAGLSVIHYFLGLFESPTTWFWLVLLYITLILALPVSILIVAFVALLDIWLDLRRRLKKVN